MHAGRRYTLKEFLYWTRRDIYVLIGFASLPIALFQFFHWTWLAVPWVPIALVGTAAAFLVGFRNTQTYNRVWEARQIYGAIVNFSRSWGILVRDLIREDGKEGIHQEMIYRHIGWLTALRFQLRESRTWENIRSKVSNQEYSSRYTVDEWKNKPEDALEPFLPEKDLAYVLARKNRATHIISLQSKQLRVLKEEGRIDPLDYVTLENLLVSLYEQQANANGSKTFPTPGNLQPSTRCSCACLYPSYHLERWVNSTSSAQRWAAGSYGLRYHSALLSPGYLWPWKGSAKVPKTLLREAPMMYRLQP